MLHKCQLLLKLSLVLQHLVLRHLLVDGFELLELAAVEDSVRTLVTIQVSLLHDLNAFLGWRDTVVGQLSVFLRVVAWRLRRNLGKLPLYFQLPLARAHTAAHAGLVRHF